MNDGNCNWCYRMVGIRHPVLHLLRHLFGIGKTSAGEDE